MLLLLPILVYTPELFNIRWKLLRNAGPHDACNNSDGEAVTTTAIS